MNVFLLTDLEGIGGVTDIEFIDKTNPKYQTACRLLEESINEAVDACFASGADRVYYLDGHAGGGMIPKLQNCVDAIRGNVNRVHILDGRIPHCLLLEIFTNEGIGTAIVKDEEA